jgi:hypothetical protein
MGGWLAAWLAANAGRAERRAGPAGSGIGRVERCLWGALAALQGLGVCWRRRRAAVSEPMGGAFRLWFTTRSTSTVSVGAGSPYDNWTLGWWRLQPGPDQPGPAPLMLLVSIKPSNYQIIKVGQHKYAE